MAAISKIFLVQFHPLSVSYASLQPAGTYNKVLAGNDPHGISAGSFASVITKDNPSQPMKALSPMLLTLAGMIIDFNPL
jgi:hypothetical protein